MKVLSITTIWVDYPAPGRYHTRAEIRVDGLGDVKIDECLSNEMVQSMTNMIEFSLRSKFNIAEKDIKDLINDKPLKIY